MKQIQGDVDLGNLYLKELPSILTNVKVTGYFDCVNNKLTSLAGAPSSVGGYFSCRINKLTSLAGAPSSVGGDFYCSYNNLTSLAGAPSSVGGSFYCHGNDIQFTIEQVRAVCNVTGTIYV